MWTLIRGDIIKDKIYFIDYERALGLWCYASKYDRDFLYCMWIGEALMGADATPNKSAVKRNTAADPEPGME